MTPFAVITDESTGVKYPLADYELLPKMAIVDADMMMNAPRGLTAASGIDAVTHALEAYASVMATDYTDGLALRSLKLIFANLPAAYEQGAKAPRARENMANAATMAGMAFANAFLGVCHSMAHKLGAFHHLPHGIANALLIRQVLRFNAAEVPAKMGTFSQYDHPHTLARYAEVADYLKLGGTTDEEKLQNLIDAITELMHKVGIHDTIREYGIQEEDFLSRLLLGFYCMSLYTGCPVWRDILFQQPTLFFEINRMSRNKNVKLFRDNDCCTTSLMRIEHNIQKRN